MAIADDLSVAANGDIRWTGTSGTYTVLELHRFLQDLADDATASGDDLVDITTANPSEKSTDNIITLINGYNIDDTLSEHLFDGSITQDGGDEIYAGLVVLGSVESATQLQIIQNNALVTDFWGTGLNVDAANNIIMSIMVKVRTGGADIDGTRVRVQARELGDSYAEFSLSMGLGKNVAAISTAADTNNQTAAGTISGWSDITNTEGYQTIDLNNGNGAQPYYSQWDKGSRTINQLYERTKWIARRGTSETIHGMNGSLFRGITHQIDYDNESGGPFTEDEVLTFGNGATGALLALDDNGATGTLWIQLLTGVAPSDNDSITGGTSSATADIDGAVVARPVKPEFLGQSTSAAIIGAYGIGVEAADLSVSDLLTDLANATQQPPNQQSFTVTGLVSGEDRVMVGPNDGSDSIDIDQLSANGAQSSGGGTLTVNEAIPSDTPASGVVRAWNGTAFDEVPYSSWAGSVFTLTGTLPSNVADDADVWIAYVDELASGTTASFTAVYNSDRSLLVRVRSGSTPGSEIKEFITPATFGAAGGSVAAIRTSDV